MSVSYARLLARGHAVLAEVEAVVRREHDVRVVELLGGAQRVHEPGDAAVDGLERLDPLAVEAGRSPLVSSGVNRGRSRTNSASRLTSAWSKLGVRGACGVGGTCRRPGAAGVAGWCGAYTER